MSLKSRFLPFSDWKICIFEKSRRCTKAPLESRLQSHRYGILAYYRHRISTGPLEGMNNKIKTMKRQAYGFRDLEFFKLRIMALHETKYALVG
ncbi:MAG: transposase [Candidatus Ozemobacteraceae bacterium]